MHQQMLEFQEEDMDKGIVWEAIYAGLLSRVERPTKASAGKAVSPQPSAPTEEYVAPKVAVPKTALFKRRKTETPVPPSTPAATPKEKKGKKPAGSSGTSSAMDM